MFAEQRGSLVVLCKRTAVYEKSVHTARENGHIKLGNQALVNHSQRLAECPLKVWVLCKQSGTVVTGHCTCMAGTGETCSHVGACLFTIEAGARLNQSITCTQKENAWLPAYVEKAVVDAVGYRTLHKFKDRVVSSENAKGRGGGVDKATLAKLEAGFKKLQDAKDCKSLLKKYLTKEVFDKLKTRKTAMGATLLDVIQSGVENLDSGVGIYAPDAESYRVFADLFDPVIQDYHKFKPTDRHPPTNFGDLSTLKDVDPTNDFVVSTRIRCARSLQGYPFNPCLTEPQYREMEMKVVSTLTSLEDELSGTYYPLTGMDKKVQQQLIDDHFLFKEGDRFLQAANACRFWPTGRGIYHNDAKTFLVWVNEEDHLRIISMQKGGNIRNVFSRLVKAVKAIEKKLPFSRDDRFGYLTFCPTNLGHHHSGKRAHQDTQAIVQHVQAGGDRG
ncbi:hypothetical protein MTO96_025193 [Rhipicephalus appendiculatus]